MMLGYLLARQGVHVTVLEKHKDFFRDFRGDTVHPSTLQLMHELGLLQEFLQLPHQELSSLSVVFGDYTFRGPDFRYLPTRSKFIALMPQWDFLNFLANHAKQFPSFELCLEHEVFGLIRDGGRVTGVEAQTPHGTVQVNADLVVGCDGRHSAIRLAANLEVQEFGVPIDVLWFRLPRKPNDPDDLFGNMNYGKALILINRGEYFQSGYIIRKGSFEELQKRGLEAFCEGISQIAPYLADQIQALQSWDQIKLLTVQLNHLKQWHKDGLLCIGDATHAMSPVGGVGINLAIQDAVAAANLLVKPLLENRVTEKVLRQVQYRRKFPTRVTQELQKNAHKGLQYIFEHPGPVKAPWQLKAIVNIPGFRQAMGYLIGVGVRPEHVRAQPKSILQIIVVCAGILAAIALTARQVGAARGSRD